MTTKTYKTEDIFIDIPNHPEDILINIPDEIIMELGWSVDDTIKVKMDDGSLILEKLGGK